jgi:SpoVK/Ycf46/Vps4 family AAA+-type ATPase
MDSQGTALAKAYVKLAQVALDYLETVDTPEKARAFVVQADQVIRENFAKTPQLHAREFVRVFGDMVIGSARKQIANCKREIANAKAEGRVASIELTARLRSARESADQTAERAVWRDQGLAQASCQATVDAAAKRASIASLQVDAYKSLASALGVRLPEPVTKTLVSKKVQSPSLQATSLQQQSSAESLDDLLSELNALTGLTPVKEAVGQLIDMARVEQMRRAAGLPVAQVSRHLVFTGNPGTGKTTVARLLARLYTAIGILRTGQLVEVTRSDLVAGYIGQTAIKTTEAAKRALGGILFIDEAYSLFGSTGSSQDYGREAIDALVKLMEDHRDQLVVIAAGYGAEMAQFVKSNPGLPSRFPRMINFPDYSTDELVSIFRGMCAASKYEISAEAITALGQYLAGLPRTQNFANGRLVRNIFELAIAQQASRIIATNSADLTTITSADLRLEAMDAL